MAQEIESIGLTMDTSGVEKGIKSLDTLASKGPAVEKAMAQVEKSTKTAGKSLEEMSNAAPKSAEAIGKTAAKTAEGLNKVTDAADTAAKAVRTVGANTTGIERLNSAASSSAASVKSLATAAQSSERGVASFSKALASVTQGLAAEATALANSRNAIQQNSAAHASATKGVEDFQRAIASASASIESLSARSRQLADIDRNTERAAAGIRNVKAAADDTAQSMLAIARTATAALTGGALVTGSVGISKALFQASAAAERLRTMLDFASGGNGAREIEYLRGVTERLGLQFSSTSVAYGQFQAAARGTALEGQKARDVFESIAKASAVMGLSADQTSGVLLALQQMISKGTVQAEELRGQLGERLPGAFQTAARAMGVTTAELGKMLEQGQVIADDFLPKFAKALNESLGAAAENAASRLDASVNKFDSAWERLKKTTGDSGVSRALADSMTEAAASMDGISAAMEKARRSGSGFFGQMVAGLGAMYDLMNMTGRVTVNMEDNAKATALAEKSLKELKDAASKAPNTPWLIIEIQRAERYIERLRAARRERDALLNAATGDAGTSGDEIRFARAAEEARRRAAFNAELDKYLTDNARQTKTQIRDEEIGAARKRAAEMEAKANGDVNAQLKIQAALKTEISNIEDKYKEKAGAGVKAEQTAYESLVSSIRQRIEAQNMEAAGGEKVNESQRIQLKLTEDIASGRLKLTAAHKAAIEQLIKQLSVSEQINDAAKLEAKETAEAAKAYADLIDARQNGVASIQQQIQREKDVAAAIGLTKSEVIALEVAKLEEAATAKDRLAVLADEIDLSGRLSKTYRDEARALRDLAAAKRNTAARQESADAAEKTSEAAKKAAEDWARYSEDINRTLTDSLMRGFESGKGFAENLRDTVVNMFKTMVLRPVISAVLQPVSGAIGGLTNGVLGSVGLGGGAGGNLLSTASNANSLYGMYQGYQAGLGILGGSGTLGSYVTGASSVAPWTQAAANASPDAIAYLNGAQQWTEAGSAFAAGMGSVGAGGSFASSVGAGLATDAMGATVIEGAAAATLPEAGGLAAAGPYGWIAAAVILAIAAFAGKGEKRFGGQYGVNFEGDTVTNARRGTTVTGSKGEVTFLEGPSGGDPARDYATKLIEGTTEGINTLFKDLGSAAAITSFQAGMETSDKGRGGVFSGGRLNTGATFGESGQGDASTSPFETTSKRGGNAEEVAKNFANDMLQVTVQALQAATDLPKTIAEQLKGVDAEKLTDEAATQLLNSISAQVEFVKGFREAINQLPFANLRDIAFDAAAGLIEAAGGLDALNNNLTGYFSNYFTEEEQRVAAIARTADAFEALGLTMPSVEQSAEAARAQFRAMAEAIDINTAEGQKQYAGLLALQGAFAELTPAVEGAAAAIGRSAADIASERDGLQRQLYQLQGNTAALRELDLAKTADSNRDLLRQIWAWQDSQDAIKKAVEQTTNSVNVADLAIAAMGESASEAQSAWKSVADSIVDEIKRIKGEVVGTGAVGFDYAQSQFAIATAQARAGDVTAAESLPELSRTVLELGKLQATNSVDLQILQSQILSSLSETLKYAGKQGGFAVPAFASGGYHAGGMALVGERGAELIVTPPSQIFNAGQTASLLGGGGRLESLILRLIEENRQQASAIASLTLRVAKATERGTEMFDTATDGGTAMFTKDAA